ncbi:MAG: GNAT family N-acetyltransferase [Methanosphaera stadtmanae]|nr:GNAT family N-acetyltransferase [Methanosphaera stadtmanae]
MFEIRKSNSNDVDIIIKHYKEVINQIKNNKNNPNWEYGVYPKKEYLINSIESGNLYIGLIDSQIVSSIIIDKIPIQQYKTINWRVNASKDESYYIHLVAVNQNYKKQGIANKMLDYAFNKCIEENIKTVRLCINKNNIGIEKLYLNNGFSNIDSIEVDDEERGLLLFEVYDKLF